MKRSFKTPSNERPHRGLGVKFNGNKVGQVLRNWFKKAQNFTFEEGKVLSIRAQEAGQLTRLNAKRYKLKREYEDVCAQIGQQILGLTELGKPEKITGSSKVQGLIQKASQVEHKIKGVDRQIATYKRECDEKVKHVHENAA